MACVTIHPTHCAGAMYAAMAAPNSKNDQPQPTSNGVIGFFFYAAFIVICAFCLLNLYVGVIFSEFSKIRLLSTAGSAFLTTKQQVRRLSSQRLKESSHVQWL